MFLVALGFTPTEDTYFTCVSLALGENGLKWVFEAKFYGSSFSPFQKPFFVFAEHWAFKENCLLFKLGAETLMAQRWPSVLSLNLT